MGKKYKDIKASWENTNSNYSQKKTYKDIKASDYDFGVDDSYISSFVNDSQNYYTNMSDLAKDISYSNASQKYNDSHNSYMDLLNRSRTVRAYYNANKNTIGAENYNNMMNYLNSFDSDSEKAVKYFSDYNDLYSRFNSEDEYNTWYENLTKQPEQISSNVESNPYMEYDLDAMEEELKKFEEIESKTKGKLWRKEFRDLFASVGVTTNEEFNDKYSKKKAEYNVVKREQERTRLENDAVNASDFSEYAKIGSSIDSILNKKSQSASTFMGGGYAGDYDKYSTFMTDTEKNVYNYYLAKEKNGLIEKGSAQKYLDSVEATINQRKGTDTYETLLKDKTALELLFGVSAGLSQFASGMTNVGTMLFDESKESIAPTASQYTASMVREDLADNGFNTPLGSAGQIAFDLINTTSNMAPSILASMGANVILPGSGEIVGPALMGTSAAGNEYQNMLNQGYDRDASMNDAIITGLSEALLEKLLGGIGAFGKSGFSKFVGKELAPITQGIKSARLRILAEFGIDILGEAIEEGTQEILAPYIKAFATGEIAEDVDWENVIYSAILGGLSAGVLNAMSLPRAKYFPYDENAPRLETKDDNIEYRYGEPFDAPRLENKYNNINPTEKTNIYRPEYYKQLGQNYNAENAMPDVETAIDNSTSDLHKQVSALGFDEQTAKAIELGYDKELGLSVSEYVNGVKEGYNYGNVGIAKSDIRSDGLYANLPESVRNFAYSLGENNAKTVAETKDANLKNNFNGKTGKKVGTVKAVGVSLDDIKTQFNDKQNVAYKILSNIAEATGIDIVLYKSNPDENGKFTAPQGMFKGKGDDNAIYIDINAGLRNSSQINDLARYTMLRSFAHEDMHFAEKWNPKEYNTFRSLVFATLYERGQNAEDLIDTVMMKNPKLSYDNASREVVAEAMTDILGDERSAKAFGENLYAKDKHLFQKFVEALKEFIANLKSYFKGLAKNPSKAANALKEPIDGEIRYLDKILNAWVKLKTGAVENYQNTFAVDENTNDLVASDSGSSMNEIDVTALMNGITKAQGKANATGEEQSVKLSDYKKDNGSLKHIADMIVKNADASGNPPMFKPGILSIPHDHSTQEDNAINVAKENDYKLFFNVLHARKGMVQVDIYNNDGLPSDSIVINKFDDWDKVTNRIQREVDYEKSKQTKTEPDIVDTDNIDEDIVEDSKPSVVKSYEENKGKLIQEEYPYNNATLKERVKYDPSVPITDEEIKRIENALAFTDEDLETFIENSKKSSGAYAGGKERFNNWFSENHSLAETVSFLKKEFGESGGSGPGKIANYMSNGKGIRFNNSFVIGEHENGLLSILYGKDRFFSWNDIAKKYTEVYQKKNKTFSIVEGMTEAEKQEVIKAVSENMKPMPSMYPTQIVEDATPTKLAEEMANDIVPEVKTEEATEPSKFSATSEIARKIVKQAPKGSRFNVLTEKGMYFVGTTHVMARTDKATAEEVYKEKGYDAYTGSPSLIKVWAENSTNKLQGKAYKTELGGTKLFVFDDGKEIVAVNQKYFKYFAGYDYYYANPKSPIIVRDSNNEIVGAIGTYTKNDGKFDTSNLELAKIKGFNQEEKTPKLDTEPEPISDVAEPIVESDTYEEIGDTSSNLKGTSPSDKTSNALLDTYLSKGQKFTSNDLYKICDEAFGGTQAEGKYDRKDAYDAMELAVNKRIVDIMKDYNKGSVDNALQGLRRMQAMLELLPTQTVRTEEMEQYQQFSTPPNIAYVASWLANINSKDHLLEPSAGIGGIASFAKAWGATVTVNELSKRRFGVLESMGFDNMFNENAEHIDNILPDYIQPSVIVMNPPFSSTAGRTKTNKTSNAELHINSALDRLGEGGRLVAILGRGMADDKYSKYWNKIRENYTIRANISIDGSNFKKYGTTFDIQIVVIDKIGPQQGKTFTAVYEDLSNIPSALEGIRNGRSKEVKFSAIIAGNKGNNISADGNGAVSLPMDSAGNIGNGSGKLSNGTEQGNIRESGNNNLRPGVSDDVSEHNQLTDTQHVRNDEANSKNKDSKDGRTNLETVNKTSGNDSTELGNERDGLGNDTSRSTEIGRSKERNDDGVFADYVTPKLTTSGSKNHPATLVESSAMSSVEMPPATYVPHLPEKVIKNGLSAEQMVSITYAGQAHEQKLSNGKRKGFFIGDGTGVGKGRQISGIILDNFEQGRKRAVWVSKNEKLFTDAIRDWTETTGRSKDEVRYHGKFKLDDAIDIKEGILFTTYDTVAYEKGTRNRIDQIVNWLGKDFDGVIAFDEAHNMANAGAGEGAWGKQKGAGKAIKSIELQERLPNARVIYVSATGATEVSNLAYAERLGLWGPGTSFPNRADFISKIGSAGLSAMELVVRDMKAMGVYVARSISYNGVSYDTIQHDLDDIQTEIYNTMCRAWQSVMDNVLNALEQTNASKNSAAKRLAVGQFYSSMQRFYNQVLTSMSMPSVIKDIRKQLDDNKSVVIQLVNTNQAQADRAISNIKAENGSLDDMDLTPRGQLIEYLSKYFPIYLYEEVVDDNGNTTSQMVKDSQGNPVIDRKAVAKRDELIALVNDMSVPDGPLEMLFDAFGTENVSEVTGRSRRVVPRKMKDGSIHRIEESRTKAHTEADVIAFNNGDKRILVFSDAGGTGKSYHASRTAKNQQQRVHYVLQPGWSASNAVQGFGRTNRSNQSSAPIYKLVTTNIKGQKRFTSTIARRLDQLGALTKGQRDSGSGMFGSKDNLETDLAKDALREFYFRLIHNNIAGLDRRDIIKKLGLLSKFTDQYGFFKLDDVASRDMGLFLNRILSLEVDEQNKVFDAFSEIYDYMFEKAIKDGTLDTGMENVKADKIEIVDSQVISKQKGTGAETKYVQAKVYTKPDVLRTIHDVKNRTIFKFVGIYKTANGYKAVYKISDKTVENGSVHKQYILYGPNTAKSSTWIDSTLEAKAEAVPEEEWETVWAEEVKKVPEYNEEIKHMLTGTLLPIWDKLPNDGYTKVERIIADNGETYLGRIIEPNVIDGILRVFGANRTKETFTVDSVKNGALKEGKTYNLTYYNAKIKRSRVSEEWRLEYIQPKNQFAVSRQYPGIIEERINFAYRFFIPQSEQGDAILKKILNDNPVSYVGDDETQYQSRDFLIGDVPGLSFEEAQKFADMLGELNRDNIASKIKIKDGYIFILGNKLVYNNGDYDEPQVYKVIEINVEENRSIEGTNLDISQGVVIEYEKSRNTSVFDRTDYEAIRPYVIQAVGREVVIREKFLQNGGSYGNASKLGRKGRVWESANGYSDKIINGRRNNAEVSELSEKYQIALGLRNTPKGIKYLNDCVKKYAKICGYNYEAWHGTRNSFTVFDKSKRGSNTKTQISNQWFFAADKETANSYYPYGVIKNLEDNYPNMYPKGSADKLKNKGNLYHYYIKMENPLVIDIKDYDYKSHRENADAWIEFTKQAEDNGNDGIILLNAMDNQLNTGARKSTVYLFKNSKQAKSAEPITYDPNGNIIPLIERFDNSNEDTQYQSRDYLDDEEEYQERNEDTTPLTDTDILEMAANDLSDMNLTDGEKFALETMQKRLATLRDLQAERVEQGKLWKEQQFAEGGEREKAKETLNRIHILDDKIKKAENDVLDLEEKDVLKSVLKKARKVIEAKDKQKADDMLNRYRERKKTAESIKKYRDRITADVADLYSWINNPDVKKGKSVPDVLKNSIITFLSSIDFTSKRQLKGGKATIADANFVKNLEKLKGAIKKNIDVEGMYSGYNDLPETFMEDLQKFIDASRKIIEESNGEYVINQMTAEELKKLSKLVRVLKAFVSMMNNFHTNSMYKHVTDAGDNTLYELSKKGKASNVGELSNYVYWQQMRPAYAFERFGNGGKAIYKELVDGQAKLAFNAQRIIDFTNELYTDKEVKAWEEETKEFTIGGEKVTIPIAYIMGLYELSKQEDSYRHILSDKGGIRIATYKNGKTKFSDNGHLISPEQLEEILKTLTPRQKEVADKLQKFMATVGADWGNYVSVKRFGIEMFENPHYYPINSDGRVLDSTNDTEEFPSNASLYSLLNASFTKSRIEGSNNRIVIYSIFDVFANHMASMAQYNAFALPILDTLKWFNYRENWTDSEGHKVYGRSIKEELARVYGVPEESKPGKGNEGYAVSFIKNIIKAYNGTETQGNPQDGIAFTMLGKFNRAQIAYNVRVIVQQPMAILRAGLIVDYDSILKGMAMTPAELKATLEEMRENSGIYVWKSLGFYDVNVSRGLSATIKHSDTWVENVIETGLVGAELADKVTWAAIWNACKKEVIKKGTNPKDPKFLTKVGDLFDDIIYKTQVVDTVLTKNEFMRSKSFFAKAISSFMSEPVATASMLTDAMFNYKMDMQKGMSKQQAWQKNKSYIGKVAVVYAISQILLAAIQSVIDGLRNYDDDKSYGEKYLEAFIGNVIDELVPFNKLPIFSEVYDLLKEVLSAVGVNTYGNSPQTLMFQWADALVRGIKIIYDKINGSNSGYTWYAGVQKLLSAVSGAFGIPLASTTRELVTFWDMTAGNINSDLKVHTYVSGNHDMDKYFKAVDKGDYTKAYSIYDEVIEDKKKEIAKNRAKEDMTELSDSELEAKAKSSIKSSVTSHYKDEYVQAYKDNDTQKMAEIRKKLYYTDLYGSANDVIETCKKWLKEYN